MPYNAHLKKEMIILRSNMTGTDKDMFVLPTANSVLETIGHTPLIELRRASSRRHFRLFAKLEGFNPGGSIKDRPALAIVRTAFESGEININTVVIESSSGNMGIGLAQVCRYLGIRFICVIDPKTTLQNRELLRAYGAELDTVVQPDLETGEYLPARLNRVKQLLSEYPTGFWPDQYGNMLNARAHHATMQEILAALGGKLDYLFCSTSTFGTLRGCAEYSKLKACQTKIIAVDAIGSVIFGGIVKGRLIPGHGAAVTPSLYAPELVDRCIHVSDLECVIGCRRLLDREALLVGGSSGAAFMAVERISDDLPQGSQCAMIFPDKGERYLDTIYSDAWVRDHFREDYGQLNLGRS